MEQDVKELHNELTELQIKLSSVVTQDQCEARRREIKDDFDIMQASLSKNIGISRVHTEQIGQITGTLKWIAGIVSGVIVALVVMIVEGVLGI